MLQFHCLLVISLPGLPHKVPKHNLLMSSCTVSEVLFLDCWFCEPVYQGLNCESSGIKQRRMRELSKPWPLPGSRRGRGPTVGTAPSSLFLYAFFFLYLFFFGHICVILFCFFLQKSADDNPAHFYKYLICVAKADDSSICALSFLHSVSRRQIYKLIFVFLSMRICLTLPQC